MISKEINNKGMKNKSIHWSRLKVIFSLSLSLLMLFSINANAQEYLRVYTSGPGQMTSDVTGGVITTEGFTSYVVPPDNYSWGPLVSPIGTFTQTGGQSYMQADDQYGAGTGTYNAIKVGGTVNLDFGGYKTYYGFAWPAGDGSNTITIKRMGEVLGVFNTADVISLLPNNSSNIVTSINGTDYTTDLYYGKPGTGQNSGEPYAYLHIIASSGMAFDEIVLTMSGGGEFENDNHSIINTMTPVANGTWVTIAEIFTPEANDDVGSGFGNIAVTVDVLFNDTPGDAAIDPTTVQIVGTSAPGQSLTVIGEGVWSVNATNGEITFTPEVGFSSNPTPIEYSVLDVDEYASNLATVTITYVYPPQAIDDSAITEKNTSVEIDVLANDITGSAFIPPASVEFVVGTEPNPLTEGTFTVNPLTGIVTFTPVSNYLGTVTIDYDICDLNGNCSTATITVIVSEGVTNLYPATGFGTLGFEDLWPAKGDYDFNDLVLDYQFEIDVNYKNNVEEVRATFTIKAFGAAFENGFGFQLSDAITPSDLVVSGFDLQESFINLEANGTESGQSIPTIIVYDNTFKQMQHPGVGIGVNTDPIAPYVTPKTLVVTIVFPVDTYSYNDLDIANFNPFIFVDKNRSVEVHLPNYPPTALANQALFGEGDDDSDVSSDRYYKTIDNLPWAINIYESFDYPQEKKDIVNVHLKFGPWANSSGVDYQEWYKNLSGYRNQSLIYSIP